MVKLTLILRAFAFITCSVLLGLTAHAQRLSNEFEVQLVTGVGFTPQTVSLVNTYTSAVPICTYNLLSIASPASVPRITNITANSFQLSIQTLPATDPGVTGDVHCIIAEEGTHTLPDGRQFQAITQNVSIILSRVDGNFNNADPVTTPISPAFANPVALGAVISSNDSRASVYHGNDCENGNREPFQSGTADGICIGRHIGQQTNPGDYADETIGIIVVDEGTGTAGIFEYLIARGPDTIDGVANGGGNSYTVSGDFDIGVATQAGEDGGDGGWAVLYGADPLPNNQINLAIEEETAAGDASRTHTTEFVDYWVFRLLPAPELAASKTVEVFDPLNEGLFAVPGNDVLYTITLTNNGAGAVDEDTLFFVDALPPEVIFFNGDADGPGPGFDAVVFEDFGSGITFDAATDLAFATSQPSSLTDCTHSAAAGFDPAVRFICFSPQGQMTSGTPAPSFTLTFRARLE